MTTINKQTLPADVEEIINRLSNIPENRQYFTDGNIELREAISLLTTNASGGTVDQKALNEINLALSRAGQTQLTTDDLAVIYRAFEIKFNNPTQSALFRMPHIFNSDQIKRATALINQPVLTYDGPLTPISEKYVNDPEFGAIKANLVSGSQSINKVQIDQMFQTKIVLSNIDEFVSDIVIGESGLNFGFVDMETAVYFIGKLKLAGASEYLVTHIIVGWMPSDPIQRIKYQGLLADLSSRLQNISNISSIIANVTPYPKPTLNISLSEALNLDRIPPSLNDLYTFNYDPHTGVLTVNPKSSGIATRSFTVGSTAQGGKTIKLEGGKPFDKAKWITASFAELTQDSEQLTKLVDEGFSIDSTRDILVVNDPNDGDRLIYLAFSKNSSSLGMVSVCKSVDVHNFNSNGGSPAVVRKPVIYLYPETQQNLRVRVNIREGNFLVRYPEPSTGNTWEITAKPDGTLFDRKTERKYSYLFWEAENPSGFKIDPSQAFLVRKEEVVGFLENACYKFNLNDKETTDFITYWLPALQNNPLSMIQFINKDYENYAGLVVEPKPETVIRLFMIFKRVDQPVTVGSPELPTLERKGFTVVEWGGTNLDESAHRL